MRTWPVWWDPECNCEKSARQGPRPFEVGGLLSFQDSVGYFEEGFFSGRVALGSGADLRFGSRIENICPPDRRVSAGGTCRLGAAELPARLIEALLEIIAVLLD